MEAEAKVDILLVDDRPGNLLALQATLEDPSYNLISAQSGDEALKHLLHRDFAVVLLDVQMPGLDGFETAKLIKSRERSRHTPIILMSAIHKADQHIFKGYSVGAVDYMFTPYNPNTVKRKVMEYIHLFRRGLATQQRIETLLQNERRNFQELKQAEQRSYNLAEAMPVIVFTSRPDGAIAYVNQRWLNYAGLTFDEIAGWQWTKTLHPDDIQKCLDRLAESTRIGGGFDVRCRLKRKDGIYRWHLIQTVPERNSEGNIITWLGTAMDIDDQKQEEAANEKVAPSS